MDISEARSRNALFDINGLLVTSRTDLADFQKPFAQDHAPIATFVEAVKAMRPTGIIGVSTVPKLFNREVIEAMAEINERPIIFPYSNPTSRSNAPPRKLIAGRTAGRFSPAAARSRRSRSAAGASCPARATTSTSSRPWAWRCLPPRPSGSPRRCSSSPRKAVAEQVSEENLSTGLIYPPQSHILEASLHVAERIAAYIFDHGLARVPRPDDVGALIRARTYRPVYTD